jgi:hypothetical protein
MSKGAIVGIVFGSLFELLAAVAATRWWTVREKTQGNHKSDGGQEGAVAVPTWTPTDVVAVPLNDLPPERQVLVAGVVELMENKLFFTACSKCFPGTFLCRAWPVTSMLLLLKCLCPEVVLCTRINCGIVSHQAGSLEVVRPTKISCKLLSPKYDDDDLSMRL